MCVKTRYTAAILWGRHGDVHGGTPWRHHCAYLQQQGSQKLNGQQQPWADGPWRAVDHLRIGEEWLMMGILFSRSLYVKTS
jgi:hypothetical protein